MKEGIEDSVKMQQILDALGLTANALSVKLGFKSHASIYHVINGINNFSTSMMEKIVHTFPNVNYNFMLNSQLPIILTDARDIQNQMNLFNIPPSQNQKYDQIQRIMEVPGQLDRIEEMLAELLNRK